jgi:DNA-directed RNA polymerase specialized sigma24 family protein
VDLVLQEHTQQEIADRMGSSERTVRRIFKRIKSRLARTLGNSEASD